MAKARKTEDGKPAPIDFTKLPTFHGGGDDAARHDEMLNAAWRIRRRRDGRYEAVCDHDVGHDLDIHGCDLCCGHPSFPEEQLRRPIEP